MGKGYIWKKVMSGREVATMLEQNEWILLRQKGSHMQYKKNGIVCTVPDHKELKKGTLSNIKRTVELAESINDKTDKI